MPFSPPLAVHLKKIFGEKAEAPRTLIINNKTDFVRFESRRCLKKDENKIGKDDGKKYVRTAINKKILGFLKKK